MRDTWCPLMVLGNFENCARSHTFARFDFDVQSGWMINATPEAVSVMAVDGIARLWGIEVPLWNLRITWDTQRMYLATNSFHAL
jgi:hypothetical protein